MPDLVALHVITPLKINGRKEYGSAHMDEPGFGSEPDAQGTIGSMKGGMSKLNMWGFA